MLIKNTRAITSNAEFKTIDKIISQHGAKLTAASTQITYIA